MNAAAMAQAIDGRSKQIVAGLAVELRNNLGTSHYRRLKDDDIFQRVSVVFQHLGQWLVSNDDAALRRDGEELGRKRFAEGVPLGQVVLALILNEKHLWQLVESDSLTVDDDVHRAVTEFFQRHTYYTAKGYEEALAKSNRHAQCAAGQYPAATSSSLKPSKKEPGRQESDLEISRGGQVGELGG